jgi:hypothetical protein
MILPVEVRDELKIDSQGRAYASLRGVARLAGIVPSTLSESVRNKESKLARKLAEGGFQDVRNSEETGIIDLAIALIIEYYSFDAGQRCTEEARKTYRAFAAIGIRSWIHRELGYNPANNIEPTVPVWVVENFEEAWKRLTALEDDRRKHDKRIEKLEEIIDEADQLWLTFPAPESKIMPVSTRSRCLLLVHHACIKYRMSIAKIWDEAYAFFKFRAAFDARARAKNSGRSPLDEIEECGLIDAFYACLYERFADRQVK